MFIQIAYIQKKVNDLRYKSDNTIFSQNKLMSRYFKQILTFSFMFYYSSDNFAMIPSMTFL